MSIVVAIKEGDKVYLGADSQVTKGGTRTTLKNPRNFKIWKVEDSNNCLMGHVGNVRDANVVRLIGGIVDEYDEYCNRVNFKFVVKFLVPEIIKKLKEAHYLKLKDDYLDYFDSSFVFAYRDKLFSIGTDGCVLEIDDYCAIGSGSPEAIGSLLSTEGEEAKIRIIKAIRSSAAQDIYVDYPIILMDTETCEYEIITEANVKDYLESKGSGK